ncbi:hypothetical protein LMG27198_38140 [Methylocystis echinoides]|uniref:Uncharacterized protein n=1 Tax=Methylocystis echinoides TaxID=29468 RepID=A0A9W6LTS1_9HYPH|nr:hypothetical protein LMG27198_38140 [Methylocystis echinoides]
MLFKRVDACRGKQKRFNHRLSPPAIGWAICLNSEAHDANFPLKEFEAVEEQVEEWRRAAREADQLVMRVELTLK